ncbi:uncharacterized protein BDZ83DRAFT_436501 [Colletotrichum acutatum]|uniref:Uncharacterized protein n=1 Tax=Glomerella acutata TaxID=27357 RepID=A0AAD8UJ72_GLOAC|nr:uncharacterized protein BDZ83DRAFT_436501 [Colletotrichum acutatum]KAK1721488.1 hypothetical protein BDZ83DRAFT_436501 [Colletotrichum acutatum]
MPTFRGRILETLSGRPAAGAPYPGCRAAQCATKLPGCWLVKLNGMSTRYESADFATDGQEETMSPRSTSTCYSREETCFPNRRPLRKSRPERWLPAHFLPSRSYVRTHTPPPFTERGGSWSGFSSEVYSARCHPLSGPSAGPRHRRPRAI